MKRIAALVVGHSKLWLLLFAALTAISAALIPQVKINYNLANYVPVKAPSSIAIDVMAQEFNDSVPDARVYVPDVSIVEALEIKQRLLDVEAVQSVIWLDDFVDLKRPLELVDQHVVEGFYVNGGALFQVATGLDTAPQTMNELLEIATPAGAVEGQLIDLALVQMPTGSEITTIMLIMIPVGWGCCSSRPAPGSTR